MFTRIWNKILGTGCPHANYEPACLRCAYLRNCIDDLDTQLEHLEAVRALHLSRNHQDPPPPGMRRIYDAEGTVIGERPFSATGPRAHPSEIRRDLLHDLNEIEQADDGELEAAERIHDRLIQRLLE